MSLEAAVGYLLLRGTAVLVLLLFHLYGRAVEPHFLPFSTAREREEEGKEEHGVA